MLTTQDVKKRAAGDMRPAGNAEFGADVTIQPHPKKTRLTPDESAEPARVSRVLPNENINSINTQTNSNNQAKPDSDHTCLVLNDAQLETIKSKKGNKGIDMLIEDSYEKVYQCGFRDQEELFIFLNVSGAKYRIQCIIKHYENLMKCGYHFNDSDIRALCSGAGVHETIHVILDKAEFLIAEGFKKEFMVSIARKSGTHRVLNTLIYQDNLKTLKESGFTPGILLSMLNRNHALNILVLTLMCIEDGTLKNKNMTADIIVTKFRSRKGKPYEFVEYLKETGKTIEELEQWALTKKIDITTRRISVENVTNAQDSRETRMTDDENAALGEASSVSPSQPQQEKNNLSQDQRYRIRKQNGNGEIVQYLQSKKDILNSLGYASEKIFYELLNRENAKTHLDNLIKNTNKLKDCQFKFTLDQIIRLHYPALCELSIDIILRNQAYFIHYGFNNENITRIASHDNSPKILCILSEQTNMFKLKLAGFDAGVLAGILDTEYGFDILCLTLMCVEDKTFVNKNISVSTVEGWLAEKTHVSSRVYFIHLGKTREELVDWLKGRKNKYGNLAALAQPKGKKSTNTETKAAKTNSNNQPEKPSDHTCLALSEWQIRTIKSKVGNKDFIDPSNDRYADFYRCGFRNQDELFHFLNVHSAKYKADSIIKYNEQLKNCSHHFNVLEIRALCAAWESDKTIKLLLDNLDYFNAAGFERKHLLSICKLHSSYRVINILLCKDKLDKLKDAEFTPQLITPMLYRNRAANSLALTIMCAEDGTLAAKNLTAVIISRNFSASRDKNLYTFTDYLKATGKTIKELNDWARLNNIDLNQTLETDANTTKDKRAHRKSPATTQQAKKKSAKKQNPVPENAATTNSNNQPVAHNTTGTSAPVLTNYRSGTDEEFANLLLSLNKPSVPK